MSEKVKNVMVRIGRDWYVSCDTDVTASMCPNCALDDKIPSPWAMCRLCTGLFGDGSGRFRGMTVDDIPAWAVPKTSKAGSPPSIRGVVIRVDGRWLSMPAGGPRRAVCRGCSSCEAGACLGNEPVYRLCVMLRPDGGGFREVKRQGVLNQLLEMEA